MPRGVGSSPLARGLPNATISSNTEIRIIPARAGFTIRRNHDHSNQKDHPRSRGVYVVSPHKTFKRRGSSPLARGLRQGRVGTGDEGGIIPARAGFTPHPRHRRPPRPDHPRSRGVYRSASGSPRTSWGSSPLARGLLTSDRADAVLRRIIPARAGFTTSRPRRPGRKRDHPRSRGVYGRVTSRVTSRWGSSPLARGLPVSGSGGRSGARIIPARAGFTEERRARQRQGWDHPRSRGVYAARPYGARRLPGSSPLARGLRAITGPLSLPMGIIPARAGFTS